MTCETPGCINEATHAEELPYVRGFLRICADHAGFGAMPLDGPQWYGQMLACARELKGMERDELAPMVGLSELQLWKIEQGLEPLTDEVVARLMTRCDLDVLVGFYEQKPWPDEGLPGSLLWHTPPDELCEICSVRCAAALCDYPRCDKRLCDHCRIRPDAISDFCPSHQIIQGRLMA